VSSCAQLRRRDKITRGACNDDKVIFEKPSELDNPEFYFREAGQYEHGRPTPEPSGELSYEWPDVAKLVQTPDE
jgi:hypothetical protein